MKTRLNPSDWLSNSGTGCAINPGMKLTLLILLAAGSAVAQPQANKTADGSVARTTVSENRPQPARTTKASATNEVRIVEGKPYLVLSSTNWVTLPGPNERARYSRESNYGPVFKLEKRMEVRYRQNSADALRVWYEPY